MVLSSTVFGFWGALFLLDDHESGRSVTAGVSPSPVAGGYLPKVSACWKAILIVASWRRVKGVRSQLCETPAGPCRQLRPDPFNTTLRFEYAPPSGISEAGK